MDRSTMKHFPCAVCGRESDEHSRWFLVVENRWLDRVKILSWHPVLAEQAQMQSVCGRPHLKLLITHWLTHANLQFLALGISHFSVARDPGRAEAEANLSSVGRLLGELAVHRESLSRLWTGSPETLESILKALIGELGAKATPELETANPTADTWQPEPLPGFEPLRKYVRAYAFQ